MHDGFSHTIRLFLAPLLVFTLVGATSCDGNVTPTSSVTTTNTSPSPISSSVELETLREQLEELKASGQVSDEEIERYEAYLERAEELEAEKQRLRQEMDALAGSEPVPGAEAVDPELQPSLPVPEDRAGELERELQTSLEEFDAVIMKKMDDLAKDLEELEREADEEAGNLAEAIEAARERLEQQQQRQQQGQQGQQGEQGQQGQEGQEGPAGQPGETGMEGEEGTDGEGLPGEGEESGEAGEPGTGEGEEAGEEGETGEPGKPGVGEEEGDQTGTGTGEEGGEEDGQGRRGSTDGTAEGASQGGAAGEGGAGEGDSGKTRYEEMKRDDDIIARQLREAAERETDPVLKEKLWEEYKIYKESTSR